MAATIRIRLLTSVAVQGRAYRAGEELDASEDFAKEMIKAEYAVEVNQIPFQKSEKAISQAAKNAEKR